MSKNGEIVGGFTNKPTPTAGIKNTRATFDYTIGESAKGKIEVDLTNKDAPNAIAEVLQQHKEETIDIQKVTYHKEENGEE